MHIPGVDLTCTATKLIRRGTTDKTKADTKLRTMRRSGGTVKFEIQREEERVNRTTSGTRSATNEPRGRCFLILAGGR